MINTAADFESSISFMTSGMTDPMNENISYQTVTLNSDDFNNTFETIEARLNKFYEKTRILEDLIAYTKTYIEQNIYDTIKECRDTLDSIEDARDSLKNSSYISYEVTLASGTGSYTDRDNTSIPSCIVTNNMLTLSMKSQVSIPIKSVTRTKGYTPYQSNLEGIISGAPYRTFYFLDGISNGGLNEEIYIELSTPSLINLLDITASNCNVASVRYIDDVGHAEFEDKFKSLITKERKTKGVYITLACNLYKKKTYYIDQVRMVSNFWDLVKFSEYRAATGNNDFVELDYDSGVESFKTAYNNYYKSINEWKQTKQMFVNENLRNGFTDSVPVLDMVVKPGFMSQSTPLNKSPFYEDPYPTITKNLNY